MVVRLADATAAEVFRNSCISRLVVEQAYQVRCWRITLSTGTHWIKVDWPQAIDLRMKLEFSLPQEGCSSLAQ